MMHTNTNLNNLAGQVACKRKFVAWLSVSWGLPILFQLLATTGPRHVSLSTLEAFQPHWQTEWQRSRALLRR